MQAPLVFGVGVLFIPIDCDDYDILVGADVLMSSIFLMTVL
jgi:hypothetical protein